MQKTSKKQLEDEFRQLVTSVSMPNKNAKEVLVIKSIFEGRPDTIYFRNPNLKGQMPESDRIRSLDKEEIATSLLSMAYN